MAGVALAQEEVIDLYSARHSQTDEALHTNFTKTNGIKDRRLDANDVGILAHLQAEGTASPADVILFVVAARLKKADVDGLFSCPSFFQVGGHPGKITGTVYGGQVRPTELSPVVGGSLACPSELRNVTARLLERAR